jgi:hypothetical protein
MAKQKWEEEAKDRFLQFRREKYAEEWVVLGEDVVVDPATNRNFDYQLSLGARRIALELFRLVNDEEELARDKVWSEVVHLLERELAQRSLKGYLLNTPPYFKVSKVKRNEFVKELANRIEKVIEANPDVDEITFDGFSLKNIKGLERIACGAIGEGGAINPAGIVLSALEEKLPDKNSQLGVAGHERVIVVVNWAYLVGTDDVVEATSQLNFDRFPNIDKVYFEVAQSDFQLVFDRSLFAAFGAGGSAPNADLNDKLGAFDATRLSQLLKTHIVGGMAAVRAAIVWRMSQILDTHAGKLEVVLPYACLLPSGEYDRSAFFHFYKIAAKHMKSASSLLGPALKQALRRESQYLGSNVHESIWDFDRQRLLALKDLLDCGRVDDFLDCVEIVLRCRKRIFNFPAEGIRGLLSEIQSERAQKLKEQLDSGG